MNRIEALGLAIREFRHLRNISQEKLAEAAKLHRNAMGRIERGTTAVTAPSLFSISDALGVATSELFRRAEEMLEFERNSGAMKSLP